MVLLNCVIIGDGSVVSVVIDENLTVALLKDAIKAKKLNKITCDADELKLFLAKKDGEWLADDDPVALQLENGVIVDVREVTTEAQMKATRTIEDILTTSNMTKLRAPKSRQIHVLVVVPQPEPQPEPPPRNQIYETFRPYAEGIDLRSPHLSREALVTALHAAVLSTNFVLLSAPAGSGKTSLLALFHQRFSEISCLAISFNKVDLPASKILSKQGIDVEKKTCSLSYDDKTIIVVMLDDAQRHYHDHSFWSLLVKGSSVWMPSNLRFVISATYSLESEWLDSPVVFGEFRERFTRDDLLLGDDEARKLFDLDNGLPSKIRSPALEEVILRECAGHIGALRIFIDNVAVFFEKTSHLEQEVLAFCFSEKLMDGMGRLYGTKHSIPSSTELKNLLIKCLLDDYSIPWLMQDDERRCYTQLMKAGIIFQDADLFVKFTSPLAQRYYSKHLFPNRGQHDPSSLNELIRKVIGNMSANVLRRSTVDDDFPKEATFQHQFMEGLALWTKPSCSICPELSKVFPSLPHQRSERIRGEIDFFLNGSLRWGIELLVNGDKIGEHMSRFAVNGKYAPLAAKEYAVIDFRGNRSGTITDVARKPERITVFFKLGDFSSCRCIFGLVEEVIILNN